MEESTLDFRDRDDRTICKVRLVAEKSGTLRNITREEAIEFSEETVQLLENASYEYQVNDPDFELMESAAITRSKLAVGGLDSGRVSPESFTGILPLGVARKTDSLRMIATAAVEVRSRKLSYRKDYRHMLDAIASRCSNLLLDLAAPTQARFSPDPNRFQEELAQRFAFISSVLHSKEFHDSIGRVISRPFRRATTTHVERRTSRGFRPSNSILRQIPSKLPRVKVPERHPLNNLLSNPHCSGPTIPGKLTVSEYSETIDNPENRFIKHSLLVYSDYLSKVAHIAAQTKPVERYRRLRGEVAELAREIEAILADNLFKEISRPTAYSLASPVLQKRAGYRELVQVWVKFNLASLLTWKGGEDVYGSGKRNMDVLYEYWLFFELLEIISQVFSLPKVEYRELFHIEPSGFGVRLKSGSNLVINKVTSVYDTNLRVVFSYNRTFSPSPAYSREGSWTLPMRPDFTLSVYPAELSAEQAEFDEKIVHLHFDSKYKADHIEDVFEIVDSPDSVDAGARIRNRARAKNTDFLKMHSYRDAIKRSYGAYVLFPGTDNRRWQTFGEILPGLGAFAMRPSEGGAAQGSEKLREFLDDLVVHLCERSTKRSLLAQHVFQTYTDEQS